ncbi:MAG TPA: uroporphyrinogen-III synthase, partial [Myxococcaceae bacterium]|nr:uroporphyrinogen-III synthase [Myxococcaceae bacterium]
EAFLELTGERGRAVLERARRVAIGPTTASALERMGLPAAAVAARPTSEGLLEAAVAALRD